MDPIRIVWSIAHQRKRLDPHALVGIVRVLLVDLPPLVRDVITQLLAVEEGIEVAASIRGADLDMAVRRTSADVVVLPADYSDLPPAGRRFLEDRAKVRVVGLADHAQSGVVGRLAVEMVRIEDVSRATLVEAIRTGTQQTERSVAAAKPQKLTRPLGKTGT